MPEINSAATPKNAETHLGKQLAAVSAENAGLRESLGHYVRRVTRLEHALRELGVDPEQVVAEAR